MPRIQTHRACFTLNNFTQNDVSHLIDWVTLNQEKVGYFICGEEIGQSGTPHLQGYLRLKEVKRYGIKHWKSIIGPRAHIEAARGNDGENYKYCTKDGIYVETGELQQSPQSLYGACLQDLQDLPIQEWCTRWPEEAFKYFTAARNIKDTMAKSIPFDMPDLRDWQLKCVDLLDQQGDREILFVVDERGGSGKSTLAKWILDNRDAFGCQGN